MKFALACQQIPSAGCHENCLKQFYEIQIIVYFRATVYVLAFFPCLMGLAATAAARFARSLTHDWRAFCCLETMGAVILWCLGLGVFLTLGRYSLEQVVSNYQNILKVW